MNTSMMVVHPSAASDPQVINDTAFAGPMNLRRYMCLRHRKGQKFSEVEVRDAMAQLLSAVARAQDSGVLHVEIVPENVVVDPDHNQQKMSRKKKKKKKASCKYTIRGLDLDVSDRAAGKAPTKDDSCSSSMLALHNSYCAPELFFGSDDSDRRVETWSLGCVMAELLAGTGEAPFFGRGSDSEVFQGMLQVVGAKGIAEWSGLEPLVTPEQASRVREHYGRETGCLRDKFPKKTLSQVGFDVLSGLLQSNPDRRLTAADALRMPWFCRRDGLGACFTLFRAYASG